MGTKQIDKLLSEYCCAARDYLRAAEVGDYKTSNKCHDRVISAFLKLKASGQMGIDALLQALNSDDPGVLLWAATHLLPFYTQQAEAVLDRLTQIRGVVAAETKTILNEWRRGTLKFPPYEK